MSYPFFIAKRLSLGSGGRKAAPALRVSIAAVALSVGVMLASIAIVGGFKREIKNKIAGFNAHITLYAIEGEGEDNLVSVSPGLQSVLDYLPFVKSAATEVSMPAVLKTQEDFKGIYLRSLESPSSARFIAENIEEGEVPDFNSAESSNKIVISRAAARELGLKVGDRIDTYFITDDVRVRPLVVAGIFNTHFDAYDGILAFGPAFLLHKIAGIGLDKGTMIQIETGDFDRCGEYADILQRELIAGVARGNTGALYRVESAQSQGAGYFQWLSLLDTNVAVILILMGVVAIATLISGMLMIILDKRRFIGTVRALGMPVKGLREIFVLLGLKVALWGLAIGNIAMLSFLWLQDRFHFIPLDPDSYYIDFVPVRIVWWQVVLLNAAALLLIWVSLILPSRYAASVPPAEAVKE